MKLKTIEQTLLEVYKSNPNLQETELETFLKAAMWEGQDKADAHLLYKEHVAKGIVVPSASYGEVEVDDSTTAMVAGSQTSERYKIVNPETALASPSHLIANEGGLIGTGDISYSLSVEETSKHGDVVLGGSSIDESHVAALNVDRDVRGVITQGVGTEGYVSKNIDVDDSSVLNEKSTTIRNIVLVVVVVVLVFAGYMIINGRF